MCRCGMLSWSILSWCILGYGLFCCFILFYYDTVYCYAMARHGKVDMIHCIMLSLLYNVMEWSV